MIKILNVKNRKISDNNSDKYEKQEKTSTPKEHKNG